MSFDLETAANPTGLRRIAIDDQKIVDKNNGQRHEATMVGLIKDYGLLHEAEMVPRSYGGNSWFCLLYTSPSPRDCS